MCVCTFAKIMKSKSFQKGGSTYVYMYISVQLVYAEWVEKIDATFSERKEVTDPMKKLCGFYPSEFLEAYNSAESVGTV